jgi:hypothetical protein
VVLIASSGWVDCVCMGDSAMKNDTVVAINTEVMSRSVLPDLLAMHSDVQYPR